MPLTVALPRERRERERRVALVPAAVRRLLERPGVTVRIESDCGRAAGFRDETYEGVDVAPDFAATVDGADIVCKVGVPTLPEIERLAPGTVLVSLTRAFLHLPEIAALADGGVTTVAMDLVPRTARARAMDALSSQATVAGYKAALLAAELSPRLFPMMTTAAGTIRPSRVVVVGAGVAGLQAIATARRLGAVVEAYDIRGSARERIESLGARMIDTGVEATDAAGHARALRRDEQQRQQDVLAEHLARAHAVICAASIPNRPAPRIVTREMVEGMLPDTVIVDLAATTGGNCELTRPGDEVHHGDTLIVGPLNLPSQGAVHASEMYSRNVEKMFELLIDENGTLALEEPDEIVARCVLTHAGEVCHGETATSMGRVARAFGGTSATDLAEEEDAEAGWASDAPDGEPLRRDAKASLDEPTRSETPVSTVASRAETVRSDEALASDEERADAMRTDAGVTGAAAERARSGHGSAAAAAEEASRGGVARDTDARPPGSAPRSDAKPAVADARDASRRLGEGDGAGAPAEEGTGAPAATETGEERASGDADETDGDGEGGLATDDGPPDDLTVIDGIGPALQGRLYDFGITRLATLAELDEAARQRLAVQLELDDEIERDDWAGQARARLTGGSDDATGSAPTNGDGPDGERSEH